GVVSRAQQDQIIEARLPAVRPVHDVMRLDEALAPAPRKSTASISRPQRPPDRRRHDPRLASDAKRLPVPILDQHDEIVMAREPPNRLDRQPRAPRPSAEGRLL